MRSPGPGLRYAPRYPGNELPAPVVPPAVPPAAGPAPAPPIITGSRGDNAALTSLLAALAARGLVIDETTP